MPSAAPAPTDTSQPAPAPNTRALWVFQTDTFTLVLGGVAAISLIVGGIGIFFGYYPANRTASLDPMVALAL